MNREGQHARAVAGDELALRIQQLRRKRQAGGEEPSLLRIDNRDEAAKAPFQFDCVRGRLHLRGCRAIPAGNASALYGVWEVGPEELKLACPHCKPGPAPAQEPDPAGGNDLLYGLLSILDQFGGVLRERGKEFRQNGRGKHLKLDLEGLYQAFGRQEQATLGIVIEALEGMLRRVRDLDRDFDEDTDRRGE